MRLLVLLCGTAALLPGSPAWADLFELHGGGVVQGQLVEEPPVDPKHYKIALFGGGHMVLERAQVKRYRRQSAKLPEYQRRAASAPLTVEAQWELAQWCDEAGLQEQRRWHLQQVIELDNNHVAARRALGYSQVGGRWTNPREFREREGYVRYDGKWRTRQEIELIKQREKTREAHRQWAKNLKRWREQLNSQKGYEVQAAWENLEAIEDPAAIDPLTALIMMERLQPLRMAFVQILARIQHDRAVHQLIFLSLVDPDPEIVELCIDKVVERRLPETVPIYIRALQNVANSRVNRAALALQKLGDPQAIEPLIESLITTHKFVIHSEKQGNHVFSSARPANEAAAKALAAQDAQAATIGPMLSQAHSGFTANEVNEAFNYTLKNPAVLAALVELTQGVSFGYDQPTWRRWLASQRQNIPSFATRRGQQ